jgi:hypothetical protein
VPVGIAGGLAVLSNTGSEAKRQRERAKRHRAQAKKKKKKTCPSCPSPPVCPECPIAPARMECLGPSDTSQGATRRFAQTFTANRTGNIQNADVQIGFVPAGINFTVEIRSVDGDGVPTATVLGTGQILDVPATSAVLRTFTAIFSSPVPIVQGTQYALVLTDQTNSGYAAALRTGDALER